MSKRYNDTEIWEEDWFLSLGQSEMLYWKYCTDKCDHAGFFRPNKVRFCQAVKIEDFDLDEFVKKVNAEKERIIILPNGRWWFTGYVRFQYGKKNTKMPAILKTKNRCHRSVIELLDLNNICYKSNDYGFEVIKGSIKGLATPQEAINKDLIKGLKYKKQNNQDINPKDGRIPYPEEFEIIWKLWPRKDAKAEAFKEWNLLPADIKSIVKPRIQAYKTIQLAEGLSHPHLRTWLHQRRWDDDTVVKKANEIIKYSSKPSDPQKTEPPLTDQEKENLGKKIIDSIPAKIRTSMEINKKQETKGTICAPESVQ